MTADKILQALMRLRAPQAQDEYDLHGLVADALAQAEITFRHEAPLAPRCRIDFLCGQVGIEIKRNKPEKVSLEKQMRRYAQTGKLAALILIAEKLPDLPAYVESVPIYPVSLQKLWGLAAEGKGAVRAVHSLQEKEPDGELERIEDTLLKEIENEDVPLFLRDAEASGEYYGTLSYNARRKCWVIKGDPGVTEMAKRLFPGSDAKRGEARFTAHRRIIGDVNWLMQRYPLQVAHRDQERWRQALRQAREYYQNRKAAKMALPAAQPSSSVFTGELRPFQQQGLSWLLLTPRALLSDEMGLGKTVQALACAAQERKFPLLIVPPPHLCRNWMAETMRFLRVDGREPRIHLIKGLPRRVSSKA